MKKLVFIGWGLVLLVLTIWFALATVDTPATYLNSTLSNNYTTANLTAYITNLNASLHYIYSWQNNGNGEMVFYMPMIGPNLTAYDFSGNGFDGTCINETSFNESSGFDGYGAYKFDGVNDYITVPNNESLVFNNRSYTITAWIYPTVGAIAILGKGNESGPMSGPNSGYTLFLTGTRKLLLFWGGIGNQYPTSTLSAVPTNTWSFVSYGINNETQQVIYAVNSEYQALNTSTKTVNGTGPLVIGSAAAFDFRGAIDEVRIYNRSLSQEELLALYMNKTNQILAERTTKGDNWTVTAWAVNSTGINGSSGESSIIINNAPPIAPTIVLNTSTGVAHAVYNLTFYNTTAASDADDDSTTLTLKWFNQSIILPELENQTMVTAGNTTLGQVWVVEVLTWDGSVYGTAVNSSPLTITNNILPVTPTNIILNSTSQSNRTTDNLTFYNLSSATDADGDSTILRLRWYNQSIIVPDLENQTIATSSNTTKGQGWIVEVAAYDGYGYGIAVNTTLLTIQNTPPVTPTSFVNATSSQNRTTDNLTFYNLSSATDADGDSTILRLRWYNNSILATGLENNSIIISGNLSIRETWLAEATSYDGTGYGNNVNSSSITLNLGPDNQKVCPDGKSCEYTNITFALTNENNTGNIIHLFQANYEFNMSPNILANFTPINVSKDNITLDCRNSILQGESSIGVDIYSDGDTVKNCYLYNWTSGIFVEGNNSQIFNNTFGILKNYSINISFGTTTSIWLNNFYSRGISNMVSENVVDISVGSTAHSDYGLGFPVTYKFSIPSGSTNLTAYKRYLASESWTQIAEKTSSDIFNGIEAVRFDYANDIAFVSVAFNGSSDDIYLNLTDSFGTAQAVSYLGMSKYYDNRSAAVVITADDWTNQAGRSALFASLSNITRNLDMWLSVGIVTNFTTGGVVNWAAIQAELNNGLVEADSHSRYHSSTCLLNATCAETEVNISKRDIINNLDLPSIYKNGGNEYVWGWIAPNGVSWPTRPYLGGYKYLADRSYTSLNSGVNYSDWHATDGVYNSTPISLDPFNGDLATCNNTFDAAASAGGIYLVTIHPYQMNMTNNSWERRHLQYISNRTNIWYAGFGQLYAYHYVQERNITTVNTHTSPDADFCVNNEGNFYKQNLNVTSGDCGPLNITLPRDNDEYSNILNMTWSQQSSSLPITYYIDLLLPNIGWTTKTTTTTTNLLLDTRDYVDGQYEMNIVPFDGNYNGTINHTFFRIRNTPGQESGGAGGGTAIGGEAPPPFSPEEIENITSGEPPIKEQVTEEIEKLFNQVYNLGNNVSPSNSLLGWAAIILVVCGLFFAKNKIKDIMEKKKEEGRAERKNMPRKKKWWEL